jgi:hypothetical protein
MTETVDQQPVPTPQVRPPAPGRLRVGAVAAAALALVVGAAATMAASPSPSASPGATTNPDATAKPDGFWLPGDGTIRDGLRGRGFPFPGADFERGFGHGPGLGHGLGFGRITVSSVDGSSVSLVTDDGWTRTVTVTDETTITRGGHEVDLDELEEGDTVRLGQRRRDEDTYTVTVIEIVVPRVAGTVTAIDDDSITITGRDGTSREIATTAETTYDVGPDGGSRDDVVVGARIVAAGESGDDESFTASSVTVVLPHVAGEVTEVGDDSLTLERRDGTTVTVNVTDETTFLVPGVDDADLADIEAGMAVIVEGHQNGDAIDAVSVAAGFKGRMFHGGPFDLMPAQPEEEPGSEG